jgi:transposase
MADRTTLQERLQILELSEAGFTDPSIAQKIGRSVWTVRKWRRRGTRSGRSALASHNEMGRPHRGALCRFPEAMSERLLRWRKAHPGWGPKTLLAELEASYSREEELSLPSRASIGRLLKEKGLSRSYQKHSRLPAPSLRSATAPHQLWEMDARGNEKVAGLGHVALIALNDRHSRARLLCYPCQLEGPQSHPKTVEYKTLLRLAFSEWGLPESLQVDHESVFFENVSKSPFPTGLHLWLCALGVELCFARPHRPTDQAITERSHTLWYEQVLQGASFSSWEELYEALLKRRPFLNRLLPCATLAHRAPLVAFPQADHSGRPYAAYLEEELLEMGRVDRLLEKGKWFRRVSKDLTVSLGGLVYYLKGAKRGEQVRIIYEASDRHLLFEDEAAEVLGRKPIKGLSVEDLLGEGFEPYVSWPYYQPRLPFSLAEQGAVRVRETMAA